MRRPLSAARLFLASLTHQGLYKDGLFLMIQASWASHGHFVRWSEIQNYRWGEQGQFIVNPDVRPMTFRIPEGRAEDLKEALREKIPNAEITVPNVET